MLNQLKFYQFLLPGLLFSFLFQFQAKAQIDSVLFSAIKSNDLTALQQRLKSKIDINAVDQNGANGLMWAVYYCDLPMVKYLVQHGSRVGGSGVIFINEDVGYYSSLQSIAARKGKLDLLKYLADSLRLSLNETDNVYNSHNWKKEGQAVLSCAVEYGHMNIIKYLLQKGVQIDVAGIGGTSTPLIKAAETEQWDIFDLLLKTEANKRRFGKQADDFRNAVIKLKQPFATPKAKELKVRQFTLELRKAYFGESAIGYATGLNRLAHAHDNSGEYEKAEQFYQMAIELLKRISAEDHSEYIFSLNGLAFTYYNTAQYGKAIPLLEQSLTVIKKIYGEETWPGAYNLALQAVVYTRMGRYDKALALYQHALAITEKVMGKGHISYLWILNNCAFLYTSMGLHREAIPLYQEALPIKKEIYGENGDSYGGNLFDLAHAYIQLGQYTEALPLFEQASAIMQKSFGEKHQYYAMAIDGQAFIYERLGSYNKAMSLYEKVLAIYKEAFGESHPYYASSLNNIAALHLGKGEYNKALFFYQQALRVRKNSLKEDHPDYAQSLTNLGVIYERKELYDSAFHLYEEALVLTKKAVGEEHHFYANCLAKLASLHSRIGNYETALNSYQQALAIRKKIFGGEHPDDVDILNCLGLIYGTLGNSSDGSPLLIEASTLQLNHLKHTYSILSELEKMIFLNKEAYQFNYIPSVVFTDGVDQGVLINQAYSNELALKGMVLEDQQTVLNSIRKSEDTITLSLYNHWRFNKAFLGKQLLLPLHQRVSYFDSLQEVTNQLEQQISRHSIAFSNQQYSQNIKVIDIAQHLKKTEAAVEFIRFPFYNKKWTDSVMYAAMLLLPGDSVARFIPLCEEKQLLRLLASSADATTDDVAIEQLYGNESGAGTLSDSLYQLTWKPIEKWLEGISTVYYAPTGLLHRIAFQSLRPDATHFLIDKYWLNQVLSTRSVVWEAQLNSNPQSAGVWGNISYTMKNSLTSRQPTRGAQSTRGQNTINTSAFSFNFYNADTRVFRGGSEWDPLPSTRQEMDSLKTVFQLSGISITGYSGSFASEETFKKMDGKSPQILHLATHGFFLPVTESKSKIDFKINAGYTFKVQQNPMFRSGLVLAGGNNAWKGAPAISGKEDGILTAYEIAQMDLSNTELVVLSACETALGDVQGNEGVIGLQRAFKIAGVKQLMVSLWSVYDTPTMELMTLFYRNRLNGQSTREALRNAQLKIKEKYSDPYYWAGFVLIE